MSDSRFSDLLLPTQNSPSSSSIYEQVAPSIYSPPFSSPRTPVATFRDSPSSVFRSQQPRRRHSHADSSNRDSVLSKQSEHIYEAFEADDSFVSSHQWIPPLPPRNPPTEPTLFPAVGRKPDFLHSRNPFAKQGPPDPYVESGAVVGLNKKTFKKFIRDLDAAFVLFYNPCDKKCCAAKLSVRQAAHVTRKENHAYAAVNCFKDEELCMREKVLSVPTMKLYVKGMTVDTYSHMNLLPSEIRMFVENAPIVRETVLEKNCCSVQ